jgi:exopolysaccharide biosynthesis protein
MRSLRLALLGVVVLGCTPPPRVMTLPQLPFSIDSARSTVVAPGVVHHAIRSPDGPWAIEVLDVRLDRCTTALAVKGRADSIGRERTSRLLAMLADTVAVLGGVNADFFRFTPPGVPTGLLVARGRAFTRPSARPVFAIDSAGVPHITVFTADSTGVLASFHPLEAVGGQPVIVRDGAVSREARDTGAFAVTRHPRTAVGITTDGRLLLVVVDGRQAPRSVGMSLATLADLLLMLGARDALNLDGGGSTTMVVREPAGSGLRIVNIPSDSAGERPVGDALAVVRRC